MLGPWTLLIGFFVGFLLVLFLTRWITRHMQGTMFLLGADEEIIMYLQFVLFFPGILIHEIAHWATAQILGVRTLNLSIWPHKKGKGKVQYGAVRIAQVDVFRASLIGLAPLFVGSLLIILVGKHALGTETLRQVISMGQWNQLWNALLQSARASDFWLWMYLILAISNTMFPSESDREAWKPVLIYAALAAVLIYFAGWKPSVELLQSVLSQIVNPLIYAFGITAAVDLLFTIVIGIVETLIGWILDKRVDYRQ